MASSLASADLTSQEALSGIFGSISLAAWIFLLVPQLYENYRHHSADGISLPFLFIWFVGDIANLAGALWAKLVPTVIALAIYFCFADVALILQCLYYKLLVNRGTKDGNKEAARRSSSSTAGTRESGEEEPLLSRRESHHSVSSIGLPGSHQRTKSASGSLPGITEEPSRSRSILKGVLKNTSSILLICLIGTAGWAIAWKAGAWTPAPLPQDPASGIDDTASGTPLGAEILGYASAVAYLGARIPQIFKNWRSRSCEGLSLLFFLLSLLGNLTYGAGILFHSLQPHYLLVNLPWLIGSLGTMVEDCTIFVQFHLYGERDAEGASAVVE
ncbi:MAG: hypothetical protein M1828_007291 [Chrysothrix sp. TS-e1954]|nr:MAG: hypothetical protein M1828_007291 [Chrysothrix sp. TS-e1954]